MSLKHRLFLLLTLIGGVSLPTPSFHGVAWAAESTLPISFEEFKSLASELASKVNLFQSAWQQDPEAEFFGGTSRDYLYWLKGKFQGLHSHEEALREIQTLKALPVIDVRDFIIGDSDVDVASRKLSLDPDQYGVKKIDSISMERFSPDTELGRTESKQGYIPVEKIRLGRQGVIPWKGYGDGVKEIYTGHPTVHFAPTAEFNETFYAKQKLNHPVLLAVRYLRNIAMNYFREHGQGAPNLQQLLGEVDPESVAETRKVIEPLLNSNELVPYLKQDRFRKWMNGAIQKAFRSYTNVTAARELFRAFKLDELIAHHGDELEPINQYLFAKVRDEAKIRQHLAEQGTDASRLYIPIAREFPDGTIYHGTKTEESFRGILLQGILPSEKGTAGAGLYGVGKGHLPFAVRWGESQDRVVSFELDPGARLIDITQGTGQRVFEEAKLGIEEFAEHFGADIIAYPYENARAFVVKNSAILRKPQGLTRQVLTYSKALEKVSALDYAKAPFSVEQLIQSLNLSHFTTQEIGSLLSRVNGLESWVDQHVNAANPPANYDVLLAKYFLSQPRFGTHARIEKFVRDERAFYELPEYVFSQPHTKDMQDLVDGMVSHLKAEIARSPDNDLRIVKKFLANPRFSDRDVIAEMIREGRALDDLMDEVFFQSFTRDMGDLLEALVKRGGESALHSLVHVMLPNMEHDNDEDLIEYAIDHGDESVWRSLALYVFTKPWTKNYKRALSHLIEKGDFETLIDLSLGAFGIPLRDGPEFDALREQLLDRMVPVQFEDSKYTKHLIAKQTRTKYGNETPAPVPKSNINGSGRVSQIRSCLLRLLHLGKQN